MQIVPVSDIPKSFRNAIEIDPVELFKTCKVMEVICGSHNGLGLSAAQIGLDIKLFVLKSGKGFRYFVDCEYTPLSDKKVFRVEGCLSLEKNACYYVQRNSEIEVVGYELVVEDGTPKLTKFQQRLAESDADPFHTPEMGAIVFQHEIDHHKPVLISEIGKRVKLTPMSR